MFIRVFRGIAIVHTTNDRVATQFAAIECSLMALSGQSRRTWVCPYWIKAVMSRQF
jgi:hypothetical protein